MTAYAVKVKWNRVTYDVEANTKERPDMFKAQLFALTGVPPERQKVLFKARQLDDDSWDKFVTAGMKVIGCELIACNACVCAGQHCDDADG